MDNTADTNLITETPREFLQHPTQHMGPTSTMHLHQVLHIKSLCLGPSAEIMMHRDFRAEDKIEP